MALKNRVLDQKSHQNHKKKGTSVLSTSEIHSKEKHINVNPTLHHLVVKKLIRRQLFYCIVNINIEINQQKRGPGFWKMNNSLLQNKDYVYYIKGVIKDIKNNDVDIDAQTLWDFCKNEIKHKTIDYACKQANNRRNQKENLKEELKVLHKKISIEQKRRVISKI